MSSGNLGEAACDLASYLPAMEELLRHQPDSGQPAVTMTGATTSSPPWNPQAANALLTAHEGIRRTEQNIRTQVTGTTRERRGGSVRNTYAALAAITSLGEALPQDHTREGRKPCPCGYCQVVADLTRWADAARRLPGIDEAPVWLPIRITGGTLPPCCPYCHTYSLRVAKASGVVACFMPQCQDSNGQRPRGRCDLSKITGDAVLAWDDGLVQGAA